MAMTGAIVQNEFHHRRKVYSKTLVANISAREEDNGFINALLRTPATVDLKPPKNSYANNVFVKEVDYPEVEKKVRKVATPEWLRLTCFRFSRTTNDRGPTTTF